MIGEIDEAVAGVCSRVEGRYFMVMEACAYLSPAEKNPTERKGLKMHSRRVIKREREKMGRQNTGMKRISHGKKKRIFFFIKTEYSKKEKRKSNILK